MQANTIASYPRCSYRNHECIWNAGVAFFLVLRRFQFLMNRDSCSLGYFTLVFLRFLEESVPYIRGIAHGRNRFLARKLFLRIDSYLENWFLLRNWFFLGIYSFWESDSLGQTDSWKEQIHPSLFPFYPGRRNHISRFQFFRNRLNTIISTCSDDHLKFVIQSIT